jgi:ABC-type transport system involved in multi-copper enzyme maturation permease subunit
VKIKPMRITPVKDIVFLLWRELIRDKIFISLSAAAMVLVFASLILNEMVVGQEIKASKDLGLSVLNIFSLFILIFLGIHLVSKDINNKSLYLLFSRPVKRWEYLVGSTISIFLAVLAAVAVIITTIFLLTCLQNEFWIGPLLIAAYFTLLEMLLVLAFAILFALIASPQLAMFLTLIMYVIGHTLQEAAQIVDRSANTVLKYFILLGSALLPNLEYFNKKPEIIYGLDLPFAYFLNAAGYSLSYTVLVFLLCIYLFNRKEI